ncbi:MAG: hypothetical protein KF678_03930 [Phycisphaeraceae bacterium]|nr:hypothetical protein [Phycisphaeraceae bacterium]
MKRPNLVWALLAIVPVAWGQAPAERQPPARLSRADLADLYLDVERALRANPTPPGAAEINRLFDQATLRFFGGMNVAESIREVADRVRFGDEVTPNHAFASSLRVSASPAVMCLERPEDVTIRVEPMYDVPPVGAVGVRVMAPSGKVVLDSAVTEARAEFRIEAGKFGVGTYRVELLSGQAPRFTARLVVTERPLNAVRDELLKELATIGEPEEGGPIAAESVAACRARIQLLTDTPSKDNSAQFMADPIALRREVEREIEALRAGKDPYRDRRGDYWRVFTFRGAEVPARVLAPSTGQGPFPVIFALHGAGGDESMWAEGYGGGQLAALVEKHKFIAVCPRTELLIGNSALFDAVFKTTADLYPIDRARVYLMGHSLGAMASTGIASQRADSIAAVCLFAGMGRFPARGSMPPTLIVAGELDPLFSARQVEAGVARAKEAGLPVELRMLKDRGHTLLVGEELPGAVGWLLRRSR